MVDQHGLLEVLSSFARTLVRSYDVGEVLYHLSDSVVQVLGATGGGVSLGAPDGTLRFVTATDDASTRAEILQDEFQEGPCNTAFSTGARVLVRDLKEEERWSAFTPGALGVGFRSVAGIPMSYEDRVLGALNIYFDRPFDWPDEDVEAAQLLADVATGYVRNLRQLDESRRLSEQLQHALDSRVVIEQAKGILAERIGLDVADAFQLLRSYARSNGRRLHDVARDVIAGRLQLPA